MSLVNLKPITASQAEAIVLRKRVQEAIDAIPTPTNGVDGANGLKGSDGAQGADGITTIVTKEVLANKELLLEKGEFEEFKAMMLKMEQDIRNSLAQTHNYWGGGMAELVNVIEVSEDTTVQARKLLKNKFNVILVLTAGITVTLPEATPTKIVWVQQGYQGNGEFTVCKA